MMSVWQTKPSKRWAFEVDLFRTEPNWILPFISCQKKRVTWAAGSELKTLGAADTHLCSPPSSNQLLKRCANKSQMLTAAALLATLVSSSLFNVNTCSSRLPLCSWRGYSHAHVKCCICYEDDDDDDDNRMSITDVIRVQGANWNKSLTVLESSEKLLRITRVQYASSLNQYHWNDCHLLQSDWSKYKRKQTSFWLYCIVTNLRCTTCGLLRSPYGNSCGQL